MIKKNKSTIYDVAKKAGVSASMVSRVFVGGYVKAEKRALVEKVVRELGYFPSPLARGLRGRRTKTLGLVFSWLSHPTVADYFYSQILSAVVEACAAKDYQLLVSNFTGRLDDDSGWRCRQMLHDSRVDGVLMLAPRSATKALADMVHDSKARVICLCHTDKDLNYVDADQVSGMEWLLDHLVAKGHRRFSFVSGESSLVSNAAVRQKAFVEGLRQRGIEVAEPYLRKANFSPDAGRKAMQQLLELPQPPSVVVCSSDLQAFGALDYMKDAGIPKDKQPEVTGIDDRPEAAAYNLTTLRQPFFEMARLATEELIKGMEARSDSKVQVLMPMQLVKRG